MKMQNGQLARVSVLVLLLLGIGATVQAQNNVDLKVGDVLAAVGNGTYQVYNPASGNLLGSIKSGSGDTRGCAVDSSYHPITTDLSDALVSRWNVNSVPSFNIPNAPISTIPAGGESVAFDSLGNLYVGQPGGNGCVLEYDVTGKSAGNLPKSCSNTSTLKGGTAWIDLSADAGTVYFGNGSSKTVSQFSVSCTKSPKNCISGFGPNLSAVYGVRVLTPKAATYSGGYLLAAAQSQVVLLDSSGKLVRSYTVSGENDFEILTLLAGDTQFAAGSPSTHTIYVFDYKSSTFVSTISPIGGPAGMCTYGLADAAQPQPQLANVRSCQTTPLPTPGTASVSPPGGQCPYGYTSNTATFDLPGDSTASKLEVTFPDLTKSGTLTAHVTMANPASVLSDPSVIASNTGLPDGGPFICTHDPNNVCYVWEVEPGDITLGTDFFYADVLLNQGGAGDPAIHGLKNAAIDVTYLTGKIFDGGMGGRSSLSVYTLNTFVPSGGAKGIGDVVCSTKNHGYTSPVIVGQTYNFGSVVPFKFEVAASQQDCNKGNFRTDLDSTAYLTLEQCNPTPDGTDCTFASSNAPASAVVDVSGNSGVAPVYRLSAPQYILNDDSSNLTPGACYFAQTSAPAITSFNTFFCLTGK